jgi:hypothetical protein
VDAPQLRRRVNVEGQRTSVLVDVPALPFDANGEYHGGIPVGDARLFGTAWAWARMGAQRVRVKLEHTLQAANENPFEARVVFADGPPVGTASWLFLDTFPAFTGSTTGWVKIGEQYIQYVNLHDPGAPYAPAKAAIWINSNVVGFGHAKSQFKIGDKVSWVDWIDGWWADSHTPTLAAASVGPTPAGAELVVLEEAIDPDADQAFARHLPLIEALVADARYGYPGADKRATEDLNFFRTPILRTEWTTTDYNARPGRQQFINLTDTDPVTANLTILSVSVSFPLKTLAPLRACVASNVKPATLLDVLTTETEKAPWSE